MNFKEVTHTLNEWVSVSNNILWSYVLIGLLVGVGIYFTYRSGFIQFLKFGEMFRLLGDKSMASPEGKKSISSFQAFSIGAATRIGTGNLAGVATAIALGGPGAIFWMWVIALLGSATSFIESTLAQVYKSKDTYGYKGGPAYYMEKALGARWLGILFAVLITLCFGLIFTSVQSNTISIAFETAFSVDRKVMGLVLTVLTALIIFGGVKRVARFSEIVVPIMAVLYILLAVIIIVFNITEIPAVLKLIVTSAFGMNEAVGGTIGAAILMGVKRGLFSNEAGMGSAPNAAATAEVSHPAKQGFIQTLGVFVDTIVICTATAFIILLSDAWVGGSLSGIELTQTALSEHIGPWAHMFIAVAIFLFAFSSVIGNYHYGQTNIQFIKDTPVAIFIFRIALLGMVMLGAVASLDVVWNLADLFMALMAVTNLIAITLLGKKALLVLKDYTNQRKQGVTNPIFYSDNVEGLGELECWDKKPASEK